MTPGIAAAGAYAPWTRLPGDAIADAWEQFKPGGIKETAVLGSDEDVLTMRYDAARSALDAPAISVEDIGAVAFATPNPPVEEEALLPRFGAMLAVPEATESTLYTGSLTVGVRALRGAVRAVESTGPVLVVVSDAPRKALNEALGQGAGTGAAAFVVTTDSPARLDAFASVSDSTLGTRFRQRGGARSEGPKNHAVRQTEVRVDRHRRARRVGLQRGCGRRGGRAGDGWPPAISRDGALPVSGEQLNTHATVRPLWRHRGGERPVEPRARPRRRGVVYRRRRHRGRTVARRLPSMWPSPWRQRSHSTASPTSTTPPTSISGARLPAANQRAAATSASPPGTARSRSAPGSKWAAVPRVSDSICHRRKPAVTARRSSSTSRSNSLESGPSKRARPSHSEELHRRSRSSREAPGRTRPKSWRSTGRTVGRPVSPRCSSTSISRTSSVTK